MHLRRSLALSLAAVAVVSTGTSLSHASAATAPAASAAPIIEAEVSVTVHGSVVGPFGKPLDNVAVEAYAAGNASPSASAITYGGAYSLTLAPGTYRVTFTDMDEETAPTTIKQVKVVAGAALSRVRLLYPAAESVVAPKIRGVVALGNTVHATTGQWTGTAWDFSYEWSLDGQVVANGDTYYLRANSLGKDLSVRVLAAASRSETGTATAASAAVQKAESEVAVKAAAVRGTKVTVPVKVSATTSLRGGVVQIREVGKRRVLDTLNAFGSKWDGAFVLSGVTSGKHTYEVAFTGTKTVGTDAGRSAAVKVK